MPLRLLALLLAHHGRPAPVEAIVGMLWEGPAPRTARKSVQVHIHRLRQTLGGQRLKHGPAGYLLEVGAGELDSRVFESLVDDATRERSAGELAAASVRLRRALELWRGDPYRDLGESPSLAAERLRLTELRLSALEELVEVDLELGRHSQVIPALRAAAEDNRYRERLRGQLMLALYRNGQQAEALEVFRATREMLAEELGVEPTAALSLLHQRILRNDPALDLASAVTIAAAGPPCFLAQLPAQVGDFTGRGAELGALHALVREAGDTHALAVAITGMPGVGKTALALRFGHCAAEWFPDGQIYINLRGYDGELRLTPERALAQMLRSLGTAPEHIPTDADSSAAMFRSLVAGRRVLLVLDNAGSAEQVRPLLPAHPGNLTLITSRDRLTGLTARNSAARLALKVLDSADAVELLARVTGRQRVVAEPEAAQQLVKMCGRLPLAIRIAAAGLADHPGRTITEHVALLGQDRPIATLKVERDPEGSVLAAFEQSYQALEPMDRHVFRRLGLIPWCTIGGEAAAALTGETVPDAKAALRRLCAAHLLEPDGDRYVLHDLLRDYARRLIFAHEPPALREAATRALFDHFVALVDGVARVLYPDFTRLPRTSPQEFVFSVAQASAWLERELSKVVTIVRSAAEQRMYNYTWILADLLRGYFFLQRDVGQWLEVAHIAVAAATAHGDPLDQAAAHLSLAHAYQTQARYAEAAEHFEVCLRRSDESGWVDGEMAALTNLCGAHRESGDLPAAAGYAERLLALAERRGDPVGLALAHCRAGVVDRDRGRPERALHHLLRAVELHEQAGQSTELSYAEAANYLALVLHDTGRDAQALPLLDRALDLVEAHGCKGCKPMILYSMALVHDALGADELALARVRQCLELASGVALHRLTADAQQLLTSLEGRSRP